MMLHVIHSFGICKMLFFPKGCAFVAKCRLMGRSWLEDSVYLTKANTRSHCAMTPRNFTTLPGLIADLYQSPPWEEWI
jgi:hypothetical protein